MSDAMSPSESEPRYSGTVMNVVRRRFTLLFSLLTLFLIVQLLLPVAVRHVAISWLEEQGVSEARIDNIDINLYAGAVVVEGFSAGEGLAVGRLGFTFNWLPLLNQKLHLSSLKLNNAIIELQEQDEGWKVGDLMLPSGSESAESNAATDRAGQPWLAVIDLLQLNQVKISVASKSFDLQLPLQHLALSLSEPFEGMQQISEQIETGMIEAKGFGYSGRISSLKQHGMIDLASAAADPLQTLIARDHRLDLSGIELFNESGKEALLSLAGVAFTELRMEKMQQLTLAGLKLHALKLAPALTGFGDMAVDVLNITDINGPLDQETDPLTIAKVTADRLALPKLKDRDFGTISKLDINKIQYQGSRATVDSITADGVELPAAAGESLGKLRKLLISRISADPAEVRVASLQLDGLDTHLYRKKDGSLALLEKLASPMPEASKQERDQPSKEKSAAAPEIRIGSFVVSRESRIGFTDASIKPAMQTTLLVDRFNVTPIDLSGRQDAKIDLKLQAGKTGRLSVNGDFNVKSMNSDLKLLLKSFDMPRLTGYVEGDFGRTINTGQLQLITELAIKDRKINSKNTLTLRRLKLGKMEKKGRLEDQIGMPIEVALAMVQDDQGDIELTVPIGGDLNNPDININDAINTALGKALTNGALTYATVFLQPYGALLLVMDLAGDALAQASKPKLTPIMFAPLNGELNGDMNGYVGKIAELLRQKPLRLQICGFSTPAEGELIAEQQTLQGDAIEAALATLAEQRSDLVLNRLLESGIEAERLFNCRPQVDSGKKAEPRVELFLE